MPSESVLRSIQQGEKIKFENPQNESELFRNGLSEAGRHLSQPQTAIVGGEAIGSGEIYFHHNPNSPTLRGIGEADEAFGQMEVSSPDTLERALAIAASPREEWSNPDNVADRIEVIDRFGQLLTERRFALYGLMALSQGKNGMEIWRDGQELIDFVTEYRRFPQVLEFLQDGLRSDGKTTLRAEPAGVVGVWAPFNFTCIGAGETVAALLAGNSVVFHPSPRNVGPYRFITELLLEAGVPSDRLQFIIPHPSDSSRSKLLAEDPRINQISFTGSHSVSLQVDQAMATKRQKTGRLDYRVDMESGGRNPIIVAGIPNEGMQYVVERIVDSMTGYQGQKCSALGELLIVGKTLGEEVTRAVIDRLERLAILPTTEPTAEMGGLIDQRAVKTIENQLRQVTQEGGHILTGGQFHPDLPGALLPTLYEDVPKNSSLTNAEFFGPAAQVRVVDSVEEAVQRANNMGYALTSGVMAATVEEAQEIANRLRHGVTYVNDGCTAAPVPQMPFGGSGFSGSGTLLRPGSAGHPLQFTRLRSVAQLPRKDW